MGTKPYLTAFICFSMLAVSCLIVPEAKSSSPGWVCGADSKPGSIESGRSAATIRGSISPGMKAEIDSMWFWWLRPKEIILHNSPGGYVAPARELAHSRYPIRITGDYCSSACAIILIESPNACVEETVKVIKFHTIVRRFCEGKKLVTEVEAEDTQAFVDQLRSPLKEHLARLSKQEIFVPVLVSDFLRIYPEKRC